MKQHPNVTRVCAALLCSSLLAASAVSVISALEPSGNGVKIRNWVTNDPDYSFSDEYKTSVWYRNFDALKLTDNQRNNVLRIAVSQLGYHEGDSKKDMDGMNRGGSSNYIEYARLIVPNYNDNHYEWCACFVNWCLNQARIDYAYGEIGCWKWVEWLKQHKMFQNSAAYKGKYVPQPADMIFFNWDENNSTSGHIGYVLYVDGDTVYTIEGNSSDAVSLKSYALDARCIIGYGTPPYDEGSEPTIDWGYSEGRPAGTYVCKSTGAYLRETPDSRGKRVAKTTIGHTVSLFEVQGGYGYVSDGENEGWLSLSDIILLTPAHVLRFTADGKTVGQTLFDDSTVKLTAPAVPEKSGYTGAWESFSLGEKDLTVKAVYTPIQYTVTFVIEGQTVGTATYTVENNPGLAAALAPAIDGSVKWDDVTLTTGDVTVNGRIVNETRAPATGTTNPGGTTPEPSVTSEAQTEGGCASTLAAPALGVLLGGLWLARKKKH